MTDKKNSVNNTKENIINSAKELFIKKGYDAASVEEIAKNTGVTKSLLYYYFKSKDEIFSEMIRESIERMVEKLVGLKEIPNNKEEIFQCGIEVLKEELDVLKIALSESFRVSQRTDVVFKIATAVFDEFGDRFDFSEEERARFCLNAVKIITYLSIKDNIAETFKLDDSKLEEIYLNS